MCKYYETEGARIELLVKFSLYTEFFYIITSTELYVQILIWHAWETGVSGEWVRIRNWSWWAAAAAVCVAGRRRGQPAMKS